MKTITQTIKNALLKPTIQRKDKIIVGQTEYFVSNVEYYADCYDEGNVIGNAIASQLSFDMEYVPKFDTFEYLAGIWTGNNYEYVSYGLFTVFDDVEKNQFTKHITAFDDLIKFNTPYEDDNVYPKTLYEELQLICNNTGVSLGNLTIPNGSFVVENNQFVNGETNKTVLKEICRITGTFATIKNNVLYLELKNNTNESINKSHHAPVDWKRRTYGINQVIIGMENVEGEYVLMQDDDDIALNGVHKLVINDNYFAYTQEKRQELIEELYEQVHGFGYLPYELKGKWMINYEIGDSVNIDGIDTIILRILGKSPNSVESEMSAPAIIDSVIEYVDNTNDIENQVRVAQVIVNKEISEVDIRGKTINLNADNISITSPNFSVTPEGQITSKSGIIGGYKIGENQLYAETFAPYDFEETDLQKITDYLRGQGTLTPEELELYDVNNDDVVNAIDLLIIRWYVDYGITTTSSAKIIMQTGNNLRDNAYILQDGNGNNVLEIGFEGIKYNGKDMIVSPDELYYDAEGTNGTVYLSDSADYYSKFVIHYIIPDYGNMCGSVEVDSPSAQNVSLTAIYPNSGNSRVYLIGTNLYISGSTITVVDSMGWAYSSSPYSIGASNRFYITKVEGYK